MDFKIQLQNNNFFFYIKKGFLLYSRTTPKENTNEGVWSPFLEFLILPLLIQYLFGGTFWFMSCPCLKESGILFLWEGIEH